MTNKTDGIINSSLAATLVLFTAMLDPRISGGLAAGSLLSWAIHECARTRTS